ADRDVLTVQTILSEVGLNPDAFPSAKHFASWLCLCPNNRITGGRVKTSSTRKAKNRAAAAFRMPVYRQVELPIP
ncbi:MAG: transposase, partial [Deltaproteobacteria bacterium]|nr:transposase [Deltaproteobacteria bacterium]